jgi:CRISPR system Cascade subunit CasA
VIAADPAQDRDHATLWNLCWLNALPSEQFEATVQGNSGLTAPEMTYPWLAPMRTSENGEVTTPGDMSPYHVFWGMPRRIRLNQELRHEAACDLCLTEGAIYTAFTIRHGGMNYQGAWVHPLTPYSYAESGEPAPFHMPRGGLGYRNWAALVTGQQDRKTRRHPAVVVDAGVRDRRRIRGRARLLAFGYDVDNAKIRGWYEYAAPVYHLEGHQRTSLRELAGSMIQAANEVAGNLRSALKKAWATAKAPDFAISAFYQHTEPEFIARVDLLVSLLVDERDDDEETQILNDWHRELCDASEELFDTWAAGDDFGKADPGRIARALLELKRWNWKKSIRDALRLPDKRTSGKGGAA